MLNSRFDFMGIDQDNKRFILEVKSVPLCQDEVAFFPDGYRKKKTDIISPRALKHIQELQQIKEMHPDYRTILCFVVQRSDATSFRISDNDPIYKDAVKEAITKGVEIIVLQIIWNHYGQAMFGGNGCLWNHYNNILETNVNIHIHGNSLLDSNLDCK